MTPEAEHLADSLPQLTERQEHRITRRTPCLAHQLRQLEKLRQAPEQTSGHAANGAE